MGRWHDGAELDKEVEMTTLLANARTAVSIANGDIRDWLNRDQALLTALDERERDIVHQLRDKGYAVVEGYWSRERALEMRDRLEAYLTEGVSRDFPSGAYVRFWDNRAYDEGVRRLYHVDREIPELAEHRNNPMIQRVVAAYYGHEWHSGLLMFQHNTRSNANTRYHHVDAFFREFKSFVYLDDVDEGNGPFAYIPRTQKSHARRIVKQVRQGVSSTGFTPEELGGLLKQEVRITGQAGTLILADVRGIHRGTPQVERSRSALVSYMFPEPGDRELDR